MGKKKDKKDKTVFQRLASRRRKLGLTQAEVAERAHLPQSEVSRIETGKANPTYATLKALADALEAELKLSFR
jgi:transcriptional regulator with XRE-family HTH domain